jgi:adenosylmethionine-8-amino-7-oxononanoate aminotransferase
LPFAATLAREDIYQAFYGDARDKTFFHGHTYTANPIGCAAALATLDVLQAGDVLANARRLGARLQQESRAFASLPCVGDVRGLGMVAAFELVADKATKTPFPPELRVGQQLYRAGLDLELILRPMGNTLYLFLPLILSDDDLDTIVQRTYQVLDNLKIEM